MVNASVKKLCIFTIHHIFTFHLIVKFHLIIICSLTDAEMPSSRSIIIEPISNLKLLFIILLRDNWICTNHSTTHAFMHEVMGTVKKTVHISNKILNIIQTSSYLWIYRIT